MSEDRSSRNRGLAWLLALVCVGCLLFFLVDIGHRIDGYRTVEHGVRGMATVTRCTSDFAGTACVGEFVSVGGTVQLQKIRINGGHHAGEVIEAAVSGPKAKEAWALTGTPWTELSRVDLYALAPVVAAIVIGRLMLDAWTMRYRRSAMRYRRSAVRRTR